MVRQFGFVEFRFIPVVSGQDALRQYERYRGTIGRLFKTFYDVLYTVCAGLGAVTSALDEPMSA